MISILVALLLFVVVVWAARTLLKAFDPGPQIAAVVYVLIVLIGVAYVLDVAGLPVQWPR